MKVGRGDPLHTRNRALQHAALRPRVPRQSYERNEVRSPLHFCPTAPALLEHSGRVLLLRLPAASPLLFELCCAAPEQLRHAQRALLHLRL